MKSPTCRAAALSSDAAISALQAVFREEAALEESIREATRARSDLLSRRAEAARDFERAKQRAGEKAAEAVRAKKELPPLGREESTMRRAQLEIEACDAAAPEADAAVKRAEVALSQHKTKLVSATLDLDEALTRDALEAVNDAVLRLGAPLAALAAASFVRTELIGSKFNIDPKRNAPPIGGTEIAAAIIGAIPTIVANGLTPDSVGARAREIAAAILSSIKHTKES